MDDKTLKEVMRELGRKSAEARKKKQGKDFMKDISKLGVQARQKKAKNRTVETDGTVKKKVAKKTTSLSMEYEP